MSFIWHTCCRSAVRSVYSQWVCVDSSRICPQVSVKSPLSSLQPWLCHLYSWLDDSAEPLPRALCQQWSYFSLNRLYWHFAFYFQLNISYWESSLLSWTPATAVIVLQPVISFWISTSAEKNFFFLASFQVLFISIITNLSYHLTCC